MTEDTSRNLPATIEAVVEQPKDFIVYATKPGDMAGAQSSLIAWCVAKIEAEKRELAEAQNNAAGAAASGFSSKAWDRQVSKLVAKVAFYEKVKAALEAGYYIVPPFPLDIFAIRTKAHAPRGKAKTGRWGHGQEAQVLPMNVGRYVSPEPLLEHTELPKPDGQGGTKYVDAWRPGEFVGVDFPFGLARAEIMEATQAAMALGIFDQLGALPPRPGGDPIICGQILMPHRNRSPLTFFVAWWIDTRMV